MKRLRVRYSAPVRRSRRRLLVLPPAKRGSQLLLEHRCTCTPPPDQQSEETDEFGNRVLRFEHGRIESELSLHFEFVTSRMHSDAGGGENLPESGIGAFLLPSALCDLAPAIRDLAKTTLPRTGKIETATQAETLAVALCYWAHTALLYKPGESDVTTVASGALQRGSGVCQDYAHLMIALCRARDLPARYISGYLPGEGGMHAWVEVLCGEQWLGFDPTHNERTRTDCVYVAAGRDFRDVSPQRATFQGRARALVDSHCRTEIIASGADSCLWPGAAGNMGT